MTRLGWIAIFLAVSYVHVGCTAYADPIATNEYRFPPEVAEPGSPQQEFVRSITWALGEKEISQFCETKGGFANEPAVIRRTEIKNFDPTYFFRNADLDGNSILAPGTYRSESGYRTGTFHVDLLSGKITPISYVDGSDSVPLLGSHATEKLVSVPRLNQSEKFRIFAISSYDDGKKMGEPIAIDKNIDGVYQSFGLLERKSSESRFRLLTDGNFMVTESAKVATGLTIADVTVRNRDANLMVSIGNSKPICAGRVLQLPMIAPDGKKVIASEFDLKTAQMTTRVFDISDGTCRPGPVLAKISGKGSISFDGKNAALAVPRQSLALDPTLRNLKEKSFGSDKMMDIVWIDLKTGKRRILTSDPMTSSFFPTFNRDGTINVYQLQHFRKEAKTFITRLDPLRSSKAPPTKPSESPSCGPNTPVEMRKFLAEIHKTACNVYVRGYGNLMFDQMPKAECQKFIQTMMAKPEVAAAVHALNGQRPIWAKAVKKDFKLESLAEFCP
tara:strand:+ start:47937 stop:49439 length:1503 start_codon:yes stop_codon:yes gene_type:complete